jgi:hypothetical protein
LKTLNNDIIAKKTEEVSNQTYKLHFCVSVFGIAVLFLITILAKCGILFPNSSFVKIPSVFLGLLFAALIAVIIVTLKRLAKKPSGREKSKIFATYARLANILLFALLFTFLFYTMKDFMRTR